MRSWIDDLEEQWPRWDAQIEQARRAGQRRLPPLSFPSPVDWIEIPELWASMQCGLGDFARFALFRYLNPMGQRLGAKTFAAVLAPAARDGERRNEKGKTKLYEFDSQVKRLFKPENPYFEWRRDTLERIFDPSLWEALAQIANSRPGPRRPISAHDLRYRRFAGPRAVRDFLHFVQTGEVLPRQAPFPDELSDLGVMLPTGFTRKIDYFPSEDRERLVDEIVVHLLQDVAASGAGDPLLPREPVPIACLWSALQPHGLMALATQVIQRYQDSAFRCERQRRLPIVYIPVGLDAQRNYVSPRAVIRDLHRKLVTNRAPVRRQARTPRALPKNPTPAEIDAALTEIRSELARTPTLLIFGLYHWPVNEAERPIDHEILNAPLPYALDRLMEETGNLDALVNPGDAYASRFLILSDAELPRIANMPVKNFKMPPCPATHFHALLRWTGYARLQDYHRTHGLEPVVSSEIEAAVMEATLSISAHSPNGGTAGELPRRMQCVIWNERPERPGKERTRQLLDLLLENVLEEAKTDVDTAWFVTILHITSLLAGGIRHFTIARVLAAYVVAISGCRSDSRPGWAQATEPPLWTVPAPAEVRLSEEEGVRLQAEVLRHLRRFEERASVLVRRLGSTFMAGFDEYPHFLEAPELPALAFEFEQSAILLELRSPLIQWHLCEKLTRLRPQKTALLHRLMAEEFIRRLAIVEGHRSDPDVQSLVDKRYTIIAIDQALRSLSYSQRLLLSPEGALRCRWLIQHPSRIGTFHWIYRWLFAGQLNAGRQALSQSLGAEMLKRALLERFLRADPERTRYLHSAPLKERLSRASLTHFGLRSEMLHGLIYTAVRTSDARLAMWSFRRLAALERRVETSLDHPDAQLSENRRGEWRSERARIGRETERLRLDVAVSRGMASHFPRPTGLSSRLRARLLESLHALDDPSHAPIQRAEIAAILWQTLRARAADTRSLRQTAKVLRRLIPVASAQPFYEQLLRYADIVATSVESQGTSRRRVRRGRAAYGLFELAEALRETFPGADPGARAPRLSPRPARSATRLCLFLGRATQEIGYFERAAYYCFLVMSNHSRFHVERVASLVIVATTIRLRAPSRLTLAMQVLKSAERSLIHYPDRVQLWLRFYLERAKVFRDQARQAQRRLRELTDTSLLEAVLRDRDWCIQHCRTDIASLLRLAEARASWRERGLRVLAGLPGEGGR